MHTRRGIRTLCAAVALLMVTVLTPVTTAGAAGHTRVIPAARDFVTIQYQDFLARNPDSAGLEFWAKKIESGEDPASLIDSMVSAPEFERTVAPLARLYQAYFLRAPDFDGLSFWTSRVRAGVGLSQVSSNFAASPEFVQRYGTLSDAAFVDLVYRNVLGRPADQAGLGFWVAKLDGGDSRGSVMLGFSNSTEYVQQTFGQVRATMLYLGMLRRTPDPAGLGYWAGRIDSGLNYGTVVRGFLNSPEYQARMDSLLSATHPLTGEATATAVPRPALAIKVDNAPQARPQAALNQADVVYEEMVEGNLTRLVAIFHSQTPSVVGPVRSVRTTDFAILSPLNRPLLGASGANTTVLAQLKDHPIVNLNALLAGNAYFRNNSRNAPHNLFTSPAALWALAPAQAGPPPQIFTYADPGEALVPSASPAAGVDIDFGRTRVTYRWSAARNGWVRTQDGSTHVDATGLAIAPDNVIVQITPYGISAADPESPEAFTVGANRAWIYTQGKVLECYWSREANLQAIRYTDADGRRCEISPGTTWVELAPAGTVTRR
jgi:hypothetical protein